MGAEFHVGPPAPLLHTHAFSNPRYAYDVTADGQKFIITTVDSEQTTPITLVLRWKSPPKS